MRIKNNSIAKHVVGDVKKGDRAKGEDMKKGPTVVIHAGQCAEVSDELGKKLMAEHPGVFSHAPLAAPSKAEKASKE